MVNSSRWPLVFLNLVLCFVVSIALPSAHPPQSTASIRPSTSASPVLHRFELPALHVPFAACAVAAVASGVLKARSVEAILLVLLSAVGFVIAAIFEWLASRYSALVSSNAVDIDMYTGTGRPGRLERAKVVSLVALALGSHKRSLSAVPLTLQSTIIRPPLNASASARLPLVLETHRAAKDQPGLGGPAATGRRPVVVGTVRMGYGHQRIAAAAMSWLVALPMLDAAARKKGAAPEAPLPAAVVHDLSGLDCAESALLTHSDRMYSSASRLAADLGGVLERAWGFLTRGGGATTLRCAYQVAENLRPLLLDLHPDTPIISTHCFVGMAAVACGFKRVYNLVIDNHAQWFVIVPGALNLVQGPGNYAALLKMGVPEKELRLVGHWVPYQLLATIDADCESRILRARQAKPLRVLLPLGGAGAQRRYVTKVVEMLAGEVLAGRVCWLLNAGDHADLRDALEQTLRAAGILPGTYDAVGSETDLDSLCARLEAGLEPRGGVALLCFKQAPAAVAATDRLARLADLLATKPSELAFYPVPKVMLRRVGDHERFSALRAFELGDGTPEARDPEAAVAWVRLLHKQASLRETLNQRIVANARMGLYDGCKAAARMALTNL